MYSKILVPLDGSALAESILPDVAVLARHFDARVVLLRAAWSRVLPGFEEESAQVRAVHEAYTYLAGVRESLEAQGIPTTEQAVWYSDPVEAILEHSRWYGIDLIAMCSRGNGRFSRLLAGSVATKVLQATRVPVLLRGPGRSATALSAAGGGYRHILVPLDGSELAETILPHVAALARGTAEVILVRVLPRAAAEDWEGSAWDEPARERGSAAAYLEQVRRHLCDEGLVARSVLVGGVPAECIVVAARMQGADLIAMATHGRSGVGRLVLGSVADAVVRSGEVPVLLTRSAASNVGAPGRQQGVTAGHG